MASCVLLLQLSYMYLVCRNLRYLALYPSRSRKQRMESLLTRSNEICLARKRQQTRSERRGRRSWPSKPFQLLQYRFLIVGTHTLCVPDQSQHGRQWLINKSHSLLTSVPTSSVNQVLLACAIITSRLILLYEGTCSSRRNAFTPKNCLVCGYTVRLSSRHQAQHFPKRFHQLQATFATFIPSRLSRPQLFGAVSTTSKHPSTAYLPSFEGRQIIQAKASMTYARWTATSFRARGSALCLSSCHLVHNSVCSDCCHNIQYRPRSRLSMLISNRNKRETE